MSHYPDFTFAHTGLNVADMEAAAAWYVENLNLIVARKVEGTAIFLADPTGRVVLELYSNPAAPVLDFPEVHFLTLHLAFLAEDPQAAADKLIAAGARIAEVFKVTPAGDKMIMLQDPFGLSIQFIRRFEPMF
jgi:catechol 2,3-dioxygenase-like lactoylglutathione lyase family enzyme